MCRGIFFGGDVGRCVKMCDFNDVGTSLCDVKPERQTAYWSNMPKACPYIQAILTHPLECNGSGGSRAGPPGAEGVWSESR